MALAKAFPEIYQYELNEPTTVSISYIYSKVYKFVG